MMKQVIDTEFIDAREVATILKVPISTVHYWASAKKGPPSFKVEKHRRWAVSDVVAYIEAQRAAARD
jgi:predicted DNA-binding transcriptional regulator AlpA